MGRWATARNLNMKSSGSANWLHGWKMKNWIRQNTMRLQDKRHRDALNELSRVVHNYSKEAGWWDIPGRWTWLQDFATTPGADGKTMESEQWVQLTTPMKLVLIHSEISEAMEGFRKGIKDEHLPDRSMFEVELADALIRIFDLAGAHDLDLGGALQEKFNYNQTRADHTLEARAAEGGKKF